MYKDINDVIKELENMKGFLLEFSRNDPLKTIRFFLWYYREPNRGL